MLRKFLGIGFLSLLLILGCGRRKQGESSAEPQSSGKPEIPAVILPSVAGAFYPADADTLSSEIAGYLRSANPPETQGDILAVIVPHAGYAYSAPVAAYAYKAIAKWAGTQASDHNRKLDAIVILAFSHRPVTRGLSVYYSGAMATPLGKKQVNEKVSREFMESDPRISFSQSAFVGEHSAEVQIPFLQTVLPDVPIVPIIFCRQDLEDVETVTRGLERIARDNKILVIGTTDLSHYNPYEKAKEMDSETVKQMVKGNPREMAQYVTQHNDRVCGPGPVLAVMSYAESQGAEPVLLKYGNSGDTSGSKDSVVGYAAVAFVKKPPRESEKQVHDAAASAARSEPGSYALTDDDKKTLLQLARRSIESFVRDGRVLMVDPPKSQSLRDQGAAFVTLTKHGQLRGCIGQMQATMPLYQTVIRMAVAAASEDPRFPPVKPEELKDIHVEISVNSPLKHVSSSDEIVLGKHGVVVAKGLRQGVFLPQVAVETGWTKDEFLRNLCVQKAGLSPDAYKGDAQLYVFTSVVFEESK